MEIGLNRYDGPSTVGMVSSTNPTLTQTLESRKQDLESRLAEINAALEALKKNPDLQVLFDTVAKVRY